MTEKNDLQSQIKRALDESESAIPDSVQSKLAQARAHALREKDHKSKSWTKEWMAVAACITLIVPIWLGLQTDQQDLDSIASNDGLDLMVSFAELDEEEWELVDDLEFALWLTEQSELADPSQSS